MEPMEWIGMAAMGAVELAEMAAGAAEAMELAEAATAMEEGLPLLTTGARATTVSETLTGVGRAAATRGRLAARAVSRLAPSGEIARLTAKGVLQATAVGSAVGAAQKGLSAFGFKSKKRRGQPDDSLSPAQKRKPNPPAERPGMPPKKPGKRPGRVSKKAAKKATKARGKTTRKPARSKKDKKKPKKRAQVKKNCSVRYETHGLIQRDDVSYFGFQSTGGLDELFEIACEGVLRALLRKFRIQVRSPDETLAIGQSVPMVDKFIVHSRLRDYSTGSDGNFVSDTMDLNGQSYKALVLDFATKMRARTTSGHFPYFMQAFNSSGAAAANEVLRDLKFGQTNISLSAAMKVKLRNITPNDGDGTDRFALDTNPLQGRLYKFAGDVPRVKESVYDSAPSLFAKFHDRQCVSGIMFGPQRNASGNHTGAPDSAAGIMGDGKILSSPPANGKHIWSNCVASSVIAFDAGAGKAHMLKFTFNGTFVKFLQKYHVNQYTLPNIGTCHLLGLEQLYKQKKKAASGEHAADGHDHVVIEYDLDTKLSAGASFAAAERAPREVVTVAAHNSAPTS